MERFNQQNCNKHPTEQICLVSFHRDVNQVMSCATCIEEQNELSVNFLNSDDLPLFANWPPFFKEYLQKAEQSIQEIIPKKDKKAEIESLFKNLKDKLIQKINDIQKAYLQIIIDQDTINEKILNEYNQSLRKQKIKEILENNQLSIQLKNQKLKLIVDDVLNSTNQNSQKIINIIEDNQQKQKSIMNNFTELEKRLNQILDDELIKLSKQNFEILENNSILSQNIDLQIETPSFYLIGSKYDESEQNSQINQNTLVAKVDSNDLNQIQAFSNLILEGNKEYEILIELIQNNNRSNCKFGFGLTSSYKIHQNYFGQNVMYHCSDSRYGISQIKKGKNLSNLDVSKKINQFKLKIWLNENILEVSDFPNQEHIIAYDKSQEIDQSQIYRFCVNFPLNYKKGDWIKATLLSVVNK